MSREVELKLKEFQQKQAEQFYKRKEEDLKTWGLASKKEGNIETPIVVTDEEYEALVKANSSMGTNRNTVAILLNALALAVLISGVIVGFVIKNINPELGFVYLSLSVVAGIVLAAILKGIAEAVKLLQRLIDLKPVDIPGEMKKAAPAQPPVIIPVQMTGEQPQPVYYQPPQQPPVYQQVYQQPVYQQPVYQQPVYPQGYAPQPQPTQEGYTPSAFEDSQLSFE